jgi:hypothetical protein
MSHLVLKGYKSDLEKNLDLFEDIKTYVTGNEKFTARCCRDG